MYDELYSHMSGVFLTKRIPVILLEDESEYAWENIDNFINDHLVEYYEGMTSETIWDLIQDTVTVAIKYHNTRNTHVYYKHIQ